MLYRLIHMLPILFASIVRTYIPPCIRSPLGTLEKSLECLLEKQNQPHFASQRNTCGSVHPSRQMLARQDAISLALLSFGFIFNFNNCILRLYLFLFIISFVSRCSFSFFSLFLFLILFTSTLGVGAHIFFLQHVKFLLLPRLAFTVSSFVFLPSQSVFYSHVFSVSLSSLSSPTLILPLIPSLFSILPLIPQTLFYMLTILALNFYLLVAYCSYIVLSYIVFLACFFSFNNFSISICFVTFVSRAFSSLKFL